MKQDNPTPKRKTGAQLVEEAMDRLHNNPAIKEHLERKREKEQQEKQGKPA